MNRDLISVIIPTNNGSEVIQRTINSVIKQTYNKIEIIVVDDNGIGTEEQEKTESILSNYIRSGIVKYKVLEKHINGSYARNQGFALSEGEYVSFLDDDDMFLSKKLELEYKYLVAEHYDMVICGAYFINDSRRGFVEKPQRTSSFLYDYLMGKFCFNTSTFLVKRSVIEEIHGFDERFYRHQDWEFCTRILSRYRVGVLSNPLVIKTMNPRNYVSNPERVAEYADFLLNERGSYIDELGMDKARKVREHHYCRVAYSFLINGNITPAMKYFNKCRYPLFNLLKTLAMNFLLKVRAFFSHRRLFNKKDIEGLM